MRIVFMGTPDFAAVAFRALLESHHEVVAVVSQPDRPAGRGKRVVRPPVAVLATDHHVPLLQVETVRTEAFRQWLAAHDADIAVVVAFGHIIGAQALAVPRLGCVNIHASALPRWRGASPIQTAIMSGDTETGVTIIQMDPGMDTGDIIALERCAIHEDDTAATLHDRLANLGGRLVVQALDDLEQGRPVHRKQDEAQATLARLLKKADGRLAWEENAQAIDCRVRGLFPWPGCSTLLDGEVLKVFPPVQVISVGGGTEASPGTVVEVSPDGISVATGEGGVLRLTRVQLPGRQALDVDVFLKGRAVEPGTVLG